MSIDFESDAAPTAPSDALARISDLARLMTEQQAEVSRIEDELSAAKRELLRTETEDLPELMRELGLGELKLTDGSKVTIKDDVHCGLSEERRAAGLAWLEEHDFGGMIKTELSISFGRGEAEIAAELAEKVAELVDRDVLLARNVHAATLKAFIKEQLALGAAGALDTDAKALFAVAPFARAKLTAPRIPAPRKRA